MSQELPWTSFDPEAGASPGSLSLPAGEGAIPVVALLAGDQEEAQGWAPRAALALVRGWAQDGGRIVLADLGFEAPALHALLGEDNGEGVVDAVLYGASVQRVAGRPAGESFILIPSGTPVADPERVLAHPRWKTLIAGFQEAGAILALYLPASLPGARALADRCTFRVWLGGEDQDAWPGSVDLRLRPSSPLPLEVDEELVPEEEMEEVELVPEEEMEEVAAAAGESEASPLPRRSLDRLVPAPVPREVALPRLSPIPQVAEESVVAGPEVGAEVDSSSPGDGPPHQEPTTWEEADPWDLPEFQPPHPVSASGDALLRDIAGGDPGEEPATPLDPSETAEDDLDQWALPESIPVAEYEPHEIRDEDLEVPILSGSTTTDDEYEPHEVPAEDLETPFFTRSPSTDPEYEPHEVLEEDLEEPVHPGSPLMATDYEPHGMLEQEDVAARGEDAGTDPFGFLGEWGEAREGGADGDSPGEGVETAGAPGWGEELEPWEGAGRPWDEVSETPAGPESLEDTAQGLSPEQEGSRESGPLPLDVASPLPPEAPAAWNPPAPTLEAATPAAPRGPARRPPTPPPRQERATGAWILFLVLLAVAVLLGAARFGLIQIPGVTPQEGDAPLQRGLGATSTAEAASPGEVPAPVDDLLLIVEPTSPVHVLALALTAFGSAVGARAAAERLQPSLPGHPVMVVPVESGGQLFHRLMVGGAGSYEEVERLREVVAPLYMGSPPTDWIVREAGRGFLLAETASPGEAQRQVPVLRERGIPAYVLEVPLTDGARLWRVYAGAYGSEQEAASLADLLREAGEGTPPLVPLTGHPPG